jgi:hypothetical protein
MKEACTAFPNRDEWTTTCQDVSKELLLGPKMMGKILWRHAQKKNCECVDMHKKLLPRHQKVLEDFYEDYAPHSQHKVLSPSRQGAHLRPRDTLGCRSLAS